MKMDPKLVAKVEASYIATKYKIPIAIVRDATKAAGRSRAKVMDELAKVGYIKITITKLNNGKTRRKYERKETSVKPVKKPKQNHLDQPDY